jgi:hypothetical protein
MGMSFESGKDSIVLSQKILFSESFDDCGLENRGWYDGTRARISEDSFLGIGCMEYEWTRGTNAVQGSSSWRYLFEPVDEFFIRFYIRLSEGWEWTGKGWHPLTPYFGPGLLDNDQKLWIDELVVSTQRVGQCCQK